MKHLRAGIIGAQTDFGVRVRELLEQRALVSDLKLFDSPPGSTTASIARSDNGATDEVSTLSQFRGEVLVTQPFDPEFFEHLDLLFMDAEYLQSPNDAAIDAAENGAMVLVSRAIELEGSVVGAGPVKDTGILLLPRPASWLVGSLIHRIEELGPLRSVVATVLVPSGAFGTKATEELHQQFVQMLNFQPFPASVLGEQLAFNVTPAGHQQSREAWLSGLQKEARELSQTQAEMSVFAVQVPMFHGYAVNLWVEFEEPAPGRTPLDKHFRQSPRFAVPMKQKGRRRDPTPASITESDQIHIGNIDESAEGATARLWAASSSLAYDPALSAVEAGMAGLSEEDAVT